VLRREVCAQQSRDVHLWVKYPEMNVKRTCFQSDPGTDDLLTLVRMLARQAARECFSAASPQPVSSPGTQDHTPVSNDEGSNHGH
jgi:hypothetical protein